jgi:preprotein translocase subunit SecA
MVMQTISKGMTKVFGSRNDRLIKAYRRRVEAINALESQMRQLTDAELRGKTDEFRQRHQRGEATSELLPEVMAVSREVMDRTVGIRNIFDPQYAFDPSRLPDQARQLYEQTQQKIDQLEPEAVLGGEPAPGWMQVDIPVELYDAVRVLYPKSRPPFRARTFDVQLIGAMVLYEGNIAEMKTGEGKTIVAPLACYAAAMEGMRSHIVTVNDYLVSRDRDWVFPFYYHLGLTVGAIHPQHMQPPQDKQAAYHCDVVYGTNSEFGFDYLRDNMKLSVEEQVQTNRDFCIIDEVDSILIDEARTPLIISGPAHEDAPRYGQADKIARHLLTMQKEWDAAQVKVDQCQRKIKGLEGDIRNARDKAKVPQMKEELKQLQEKQLPELEAARDQYTQYYETELEKKAVHLTHEGIAEAQKQAGVGSFYVGNNMDFPHLLENALRAHVIYQADKDYVVRDGEVVIVDEFTGRLMVGRQWSDGLHQAVEAKEGVEIKQETQTLATVTIQNFFKLYDRLAGMTGTAMTEGTEFNEIYKLDAVAVPTNVPVIREDRNDLIYMSQKDKWNSILDEIKHNHDLGRPVLVGTTSVENSEMLAELLNKRYAIPHEVLNAKQHEREAHIIETAGALGSVVIATNMAGRGTDIKLQPIERQELVRHWQKRNSLPKQASAEMDDETLVAMSYQHQATQLLGYKWKDLEDWSAEDIRVALCRHWLVEDGMLGKDKADQMSLDQALAELDKLADYRKHRLEIYDHVEKMGGLHIVGTERHESRRIDNQLRGRAGRQGDQGSSRFFISLEDELMKLFAGQKTLAILSRMGMKEGDAIEHPMVTRSVERAQRKVEERNYEIRKQLLDYDEVMEYQRNEFYGIRQNALEGRDLDELIFSYIEEAIEDAVGTYMAKDYVANEVVEWCRQHLDVSVDAGKIRLDDYDELDQTIRNEAKHDVAQQIDVTLGEYMSNETSPEDWDLRGLSQWAMSQYGVDLKTNKLKSMNVDDVRQLLIDSAKEQVDKKDLAGLERFLAPHYGEQQLAHWAGNKFGVEVTADKLAELDPQQAAEELLQKARRAYQQREVTYPVEFTLEMVYQGAQQNQNWAIDQLVNFANERYELAWSSESVDGMTGQDAYQRLTEAANQWLNEGKLEDEVKQKVQQYGSDYRGLAHWLHNRFAAEETPEALQNSEDLETLIIRRGRRFLRQELTQLERFVLLQILDQAWKDHLYAMDQLKDSVGLRGFAEKDPRIEYKREGAKQFGQMQANVRDRVTELIFHAKLTPNVQLESVYEGQEAAHEQAASAVPSAEPAAAAAGQGTDQQQADLAAAERAGERRDDGQQGSRHERRAAKARERHGTKSSGKKQRKKKSR